MTPVYFLSLLAVVYGGLTIDIDVRKDPPFIDVRNSISTNVISDDERTTFGLKDAELKNAVANYTKDNTTPDFVYVKNTGEKNDLYANYPDFREIKRTVKPKYVDAKIENNCKSENTASASIKTEWKINGTLTITDNITHIIYFDSEQKTKVSAWGTGIVFEPINIRSIPSDHVTCTMTVTIKYEITIAGDVAADYTKIRKSQDGDHHYYAYDVIKVQKAAGLPRSVIGSETITVIYPKKKDVSQVPQTNQTQNN